MFMIYTAYALAFWYGIHLFARGEAKSSGQISTTLFSIIIGTNAFAQLAGYLGPFLRISSPGRELLKLIDTRLDSDPKTSEQASFVSLPRPSTKFANETEDIFFKNLSFSYPLRPTISVLKNFSLRIRAGKTTALIGPSGSGKSTIVGLLENWYNVGDGVIRYGEIDLNDLPAEDQRSRIGFVQQVR